MQARSPSPWPSTAIELRGGRADGLLSPTLSSRGGEGEKPGNPAPISPNSMAVRWPSPPGEGTRRAGWFSASEPNVGLASDWPQEAEREGEEEAAAEFEDEDEQEARAC